MDVLVAYDIADTAGAGGRRLRRVADVCTAYGTRVQLSVFECRVSPEALVRFLGELEDVIDPRVDSVMVYRFTGSVSEARTRLGRRSWREVDEPWIF
jgi:CRISPR-associated protein Cas2